MLPYADYFGNNPGYEVNKSKVAESIKDEVLNVPIPKYSVWSFELEVDKTLRLDSEGKSEIYICNIKEERLRIAQPIVTMSQRYFTVNTNTVGKWGQWKKLQLRKTLLKMEIYYSAPDGKFFEEA